jgi:hypothetical protein
MRTALVLAVTIAGSFPSQAAAQGSRAPATTFADLATRVASGQTVYVVTDTGRRLVHSTTKGEVVSVSDSILTLTVHGQPSDFPSATTRFVYAREHRGRHALIGLAIGSAIGLIGDRLIVKAIGGDQRFTAEGFDLVAFAGFLGLLHGSRGERHDLFRAPPIVTIAR